MFWWWAKGSREAASDGPTVLHCKGDWLAIHVFVALMPTHITPVKKKKKKNVVLPGALLQSVSWVSVLGGPFKNYKFKTSPTDINMTNPEEEEKMVL